MYSRGARALSREIGKTGVSITVEDTQGSIDTFSKVFSVGWAWMQANMDSALENEYVEDCFGRRRYFTGVRHLSGTQQASARRQASNSPIQGSVAGLLSQAGVNLYRTRYHTPIGKELKFRIVLPIHDAFLFEVPIPALARTLEIIKYCMGPACLIPGTGRHLGVDIGIFKRWGEKLPKDEIAALMKAT